MAAELDDAKIQQLVLEKKQLPDMYKEKLRKFKIVQGSKRVELRVEGASGNMFIIKIRQNVVDCFDFSVILGFLMPKSNRVFRLRRYNGKHEHTNRLENDTFYDFHIHKATERYQELGDKEEHYATPSSAYGTLDGAIECLLNDCGFVRPDSELRQTKLEL